MTKVGIECENLEDEKTRWGVGHLTINLIESYIKNSFWHDKIELHLYFKSKIPSDPCLQNPILKKKIVKSFNSFNLFYHIFLPLKAQWDRIDVMFFPAYMLPPLYFKKTVVLLTEDVYYEYKYGKLPFRYRLAYRLFTNWAALKAWKILAISNTSKKGVIKAYKVTEEKVFVSHLGVKRETSQDELVDKPYILYVGQMFSRRSAKEAILAFERIANKFPDLKLVMVGRDKYEPPIISDLVKRVNQDLGKERVIHYDYLENDDDIVRLYSHASLFVYISSREAFGLPPVEAAAQGVPVVVKENELNHELFGNSAFFVHDEKNVEEISSVLSEGLTNIEKREAMKREYGKISDKFNWDKFANTFFKSIYDEMA